MAELHIEANERVVVGLGNNEDAAIVRFPAGKALVQTVDFFTPILNDPFRFGQIAAANSLSDVYAMGGEPYVVMNIVCFPADSMGGEVLREMLRGGLEKIHEAGAMLVGGHSVRDAELKYGLSVSGIIDPERYATNSGLRPGDTLILTKPIGSGVLGTAVKAEWDDSDRFEEEIYKWCGRLNSVAGAAIGRFKLLAATDVTGFGLGGHVLEMADASHCSIVLDVRSVPLMVGAYELAGIGIVPAGTHANRLYCQHTVHSVGNLDPILVDLLFDAQTSGGLVLGVPADRVGEVVTWLREKGELAVEIGRVEPKRSDGKRLILC